MCGDVVRLYFVVRAQLQPQNPSPCTLSDKADIRLFAALCSLLSYFLMNPLAGDKRLLCVDDTYRVLCSLLARGFVLSVNPRCDVGA